MGSLLNTLWIVAIIAIVIGYVIYTMVINREFLRCPRCGKIGSWRFDSIGEPVDEYDDDGVLIRSALKQRCRGCQAEVIHSWSDFEGRKIRLS
jgi:hypothetical protein